MNYIHEEDRVYAADEAGKIIAEINYPKVDPETVDICRTFVDPSLRGRGVADALMREALADIQTLGKKTLASCPYADNWFKAHPEFTHVLGSGK